MSDKPCPVCGTKPGDENEKTLLRADFATLYAKSYPNSGFTLDFLSESEIEYPLNFCPECGRDLLRNPEISGKWVDTGDGFFDYHYCSRCGHKEYFSSMPFCPECGARMSG